jgi:hypothetical protein
LGVVVMALKKAILPQGLEVVQAESRACTGAPVYRKGANEVQLDCTGAMSAETVTAWLNAVTKS